MPSCKCPGREELARMVGFSGSGRGQTKKIALKQAYRESGLLECYYITMRRAFDWDCDPPCQPRTRYAITGNVAYREDAEAGLWYASFDALTLTVWIECVEPIDA